MRVLNLVFLLFNNFGVKRSSVYRLLGLKGLVTTLLDLYPLYFVLRTPIVFQVCNLKET